MKDKPTRWYVVIYERGKPPKEVKRMGPHPRAIAEKIQAGAEINLNHKDFYVMLEGAK